MLLEPVTTSDPILVHIIYPLLLNNSGRVLLQNDQDFGDRRRRKRSSLSNQIDYDEEGNEIVDTVRLEELEEYSQNVDDETDEESELSNSIDDDDVVISDVYSEIEDYDVHPPPTVTEAKSLQEAEESPLNETKSETNGGVEIDGFSVDKLWEGPVQQLNRMYRQFHIFSYSFTRRIASRETEKTRVKVNSWGRRCQVFGISTRRRSHSNQISWQATSPAIRVDTS